MITGTQCYNGPNCNWSGPLFAIVLVKPCKQGQPWINIRVAFNPQVNFIDFFNSSITDLRCTRRFLWFKKVCPVVRFVRIELSIASYRPMCTYHLVTIVWLYNLVILYNSPSSNRQLEIPSSCAPFESVVRTHESPNVPFLKSSSKCRLKASQNFYRSSHYPGSGK